jgi:hypothetical protein
VRLKPQGVQEVLLFPCCTALNTHVTSENEWAIRRTVVVAYRRYLWKCHVWYDVGSDPLVWRLYINDECLAGEQIVEMKGGLGPTSVLRGILADVLAGKES